MSLPARAVIASRMQKFLAKIHPPSPPTAQESRKLLNLIQSSFKHQLDSRHPDPNVSIGYPSRRENELFNATLSHLGDVASHPAVASSLSIDSRAVQLFDILVAQSKVEPETLRALLRIYDFVRGKSHGFSEKLSAWILSSDEATRSAFFLSGRNPGDILRAALNIVFHEGKEDVAWQWLRIVYERESLYNTLRSEKWLRAEELLVSTLVRFAIKSGRMDEAAQHYIQACQHKLSSGRTLNQNNTTTPMNAPGNRLAAAILFKRHDHGITADLWSAMLPFLPFWQNFPQASRELCEVYSPITPSADPLAKVLRLYPMHLQVRQQDAHFDSRQIIMTTILDASKLSLDKDQRAQARFLLDYARENYPDLLPAPEKNGIKITKTIDPKHFTLRDVKLTPKRELAEDHRRQEKIAKEKTLGNVKQPKLASAFVPIAMESDPRREQKQPELSSRFLPLNFGT